MRLQNGRSKSSLFLLELIIAILFFSVASALCVQLFVKSHQMSVKSSDLNHAVLVAQSAADVYKAAGSDPAETARLLGGLAETSGGTVTVYYDGGWQPTDRAESAVYRLQMNFSTQEDGIMCASIVVTALADVQGSPIFTLETCAAPDT